MECAEAGLYLMHLQTRAEAGYIHLGVALKSLPTTEKNGEILLPGDPEERRLKQRQIKGIPLPQKTWHELSTIATSLDIDIPIIS